MMAQVMSVFVVNVNLRMSKLSVRKAIIDKRINYSWERQAEREVRDFATQQNLILSMFNES